MTQAISKKQAKEVVVVARIGYYGIVSTKVLDIEAAIAYTEKMNALIDAKEANNNKGWKDEYRIMNAQNN